MSTQQRPGGSDGNLTPKKPALMMCRSKQPLGRLIESARIRSKFSPKSLGACHGK
jgi:hypothetical protein